MKSCKYTAFGLSVKMELLRQGKSQKWLEDQIRLHTGLYVDDSYISKILTGQRFKSNRNARRQPDESKTIAGKALDVSGG